MLAVPILPEAPFALARTRTLDRAGLPLGGVTVELQGDGAPQMVSTDPGSGFASLGGSPGPHLWKFSKQGYLPVWRSANLALDEVVPIPNPWLTRAGGAGVSVSPIEEALLMSERGDVAVAFAAGAFEQATQAVLTGLGPQGLPLPLPAGWRPVQGFHLAWGEPPVAPGVAQALPWESVPPGTPLTLARLVDGEGSVSWVAADGPVTLGPGGLSFTVPGDGFLVVVVADDGDTAPPPAVAGQSLLETDRSAIDPARMTASGSVDPPVSAASTDAAAVAATARVEVINPGLLPSGTWFRAELDEAYRLRDGRRIRALVYDTTVFAFRRLGVPNDDRTTAVFPLRPADR